MQDQKYPKYPFPADYMNPETPSLLLQLWRWASYQQVGCHDCYDHRRATQTNCRIDQASFKSQEDAYDSPRTNNDADDQSNLDGFVQSSKMHPRIANFNSMQQDRNAEDRDRSKGQTNNTTLINPDQIGGHRAPTRFSNYTNGTTMPMIGKISGTILD